MLCRLIVVVVAGWLSACAQIETNQALVDGSHAQRTVPVGAAIATINKQKNLQNVFGASDIWGRKVDTGFLKLVYRGVAKDGGIMVEQIDVDVQSNASVFTRMPSVYNAQSTALVTGNAYSVSGQGQSSAFAMAPHAETNIVLPPNVTAFTVPKGRTLTLSTGEVVELISAEPHQVSFRITDPNGKSRLCEQVFCSIAGV